MYVRGENPQLVRRGGEFYWLLSYDKIQALFLNKTHILSKLELKGEFGEVNIFPQGEVFLDGVHTLPKSLNIDFGLKSKYKVIPKKLRHFNSSKSLEVRFKEKLKKIRKEKATKNK